MRESPVTHLLYLINIVEMQKQRNTGCSLAWLLFSNFVSAPTSCIPPELPTRASWHFFCLKSFFCGTYRTLGPIINKISHFAHGQFQNWAGDSVNSLTGTQFRNYHFWTAHFQNHANSYFAQNIFMYITLKPSLWSHISVGLTCIIICSKTSTYTCAGMHAHTCTHTHTHTHTHTLTHTHTCTCTHVWF